MRDAFASSRPVGFWSATKITLLVVSVLSTNQALFSSPTNRIRHQHGNISSIGNLARKSEIDARSRSERGGLTSESNKLLSNKYMMRCLKGFTFGSLMWRGGSRIMALGGQGGGKRRNEGPIAMSQLSENEPDRGLENVNDGVEEEHIYYNPQHPHNSPEYLRDIKRVKRLVRDQKVDEKRRLLKGVEDREKHIIALDKSLKESTGRGICDRILAFSSRGNVKVDETSKPTSIQTNMRFGLISHSEVPGESIDGPIHNYANFAALATFRQRYENFVQIPALRMANPGVHQMDLRQQLLQLEELRCGKYGGGAIEHYSGFRSCSDMTEVYVRDAVMWNYEDGNGSFVGQAMLFDREKVEYR